MAAFTPPAAKASAFVTQQHAPQQQRGRGRPRLGLHKVDSRRTDVTQALAHLAKFDEVRSHPALAICCSFSFPLSVLCKCNAYDAWQALRKEDLPTKYFPRGFTVEDKDVRQINPKVMNAPPQLDVFEPALAQYIFDLEQSLRLQGVVHLIGSLLLAS